MKPKRLISLLLAVCMAIAMLPVSAFAADAVGRNINPSGTRSQDGKFLYTINNVDNTATLVQYIGTDDSLAADNYEVEIPAEFDGHSVSKIGEGAFAPESGFTYWNATCNKIKKIKIPESVTYICAGAFYHCQSLESVNIPENVIKIEYWGFNGCTSLENINFEGNSKITTIESECFTNCSSLKKIDLPEGITDIRWLAFNGCTSLADVVIPSATERIYRKAFFGCALGTVTLPASLKGIEVAAFGGPNSLTRVYYAGTADQWKALAEADFVPLDNVFTGDSRNFTGIHYSEDRNGGNNNQLRQKKMVIVSCKVNFEMNGHGTAPETQTVYEEDPATKPADPTAKGYKFAGWYTDAECKNAFDFTKPITANTTLYAKWEPIPDHELTVKGGTFTFDDNAAADKGSVYEGAVVTVTLDENDPLWKDSGLSFDHWDIQSKAPLLDENGEEIVNPGKTFTFVMPEEGVTVEAVPKTAPAEDDSWDAATVVTGVVLGTGTAILAYHIGTELYAEQVLGEGVAVPKTREDVALKAWELAGKPTVELNGEPLSEAAQAEKWAVESGLMQNDANGSFNGAKKMNKLKALRVLDAAKKLG